MQTVARITRRDRPHIYTIAPALPFTDTLVAGLIARHGGPAAWPAITLLVPNRRAVRAMADAFLRASGGEAALLPRIRPLGDADADDLGFEEAVLAGDVALDIAPAIPSLERQCLLAQLVTRFQEQRGAAPLMAAEAAKLAAELARLIDQIATERLDTRDLAKLAPERFSAHWQQTLAFLAIITEQWPKLLAERGQIDPAARRNRLLEAQCAAWTAAPPPGPVIAAGSTGSIPAVADLLATVARLPKGAVILPGFDRAIDAADWDAAGDSHPQGGMKRLLAHMAAGRDDVADWHEASLSADRATRARALRTAFAPAQTAQRWHLVAPGPDPLPAVTLIEAASPREEAAAIALMLRETLETPAKTAALVTPDRGLARRVAAELLRWGIVVDDSAGMALAHSPAGRFLRLCAETVAGGLEPVSLLALLKHPLASLGLERRQCRRLARQLETALLRGVRPQPGTQGLAMAAQTAGGQDLSEFIARLTNILGPFEQLTQGRAATGLDRLVQAHLACAEALAGGPDALWAGDDGTAAAQFAASLASAAPLALPVPGNHYPALFATLMTGQVVRTPAQRHPRLAIWGTLEARLQSASRLILGGLNEGAWPREIAPDPWMSEPMRQQFGLPGAARRIGLAAHDFVQAMAAPEVMLTRALKADGAPTVASRWLARLHALFGGQIKTGGHYLDWARALDRAQAYRPVAEPRPRPPASARPTRLSVTQVETWRRDPYALYARHVLRLKPLDPLDQDPGAADRGNLIHAAFDAFLTKYPGALPDDALARLLAEGRAAFAPLIGRPAVWGFWWPRFKQAARWFLDQQQARAGIARVLKTEVAAQLAVPGTVTPFLLTAKADRIDQLADGALDIIDYKSGTIPSTRQLAAGYAPQLPLEGWMASEGAFDGVPAAPVAALSFWPVKGGDQEHKIKTVDDPQRHIAAAVLGLTRMIDAFADSATPYLASPRPSEAGFGDYDHLARVAEWRGGGKAED